MYNKLLRFKLSTFEKVIFAFTILLLALTVFANSSLLEDWNPSIVIFKHNLPSLNTDLLYKNKSVVFTLLSKENNMGIISIPFNTRGKNIEDTIRFSLTESASKKKIYENTYNTGTFANEEYYPFGFTPISNSKGKRYTVLLTVSDNFKGKYLSISKKNTILSKYKFDKSAIANLLIARINALFVNIDLLNWFIIVVPLLISLYFKTRQKKLFTAVNAFTESYLRQIYTTSKDILRGNNKLSRELWFIFFFITLFINLLYFSPYTNIVKYSFFPMAFLIFYDCLMIYFTFRVIQSQKIRLNYNFRSVSIPLLVVSFLFVIKRLQYFDTTLRWDSAIYFSEIIRVIKDFTFTLPSFIKPFALFGHPSHTYAVYISIGQLFDLGSTTILHLQNTILGVTALIGVYHIIKYFFPQENKWVLSLFSLSIALNPLFFSSSLGCHPDYAVMVFGILTLWSYVSKKKILFSFFSLLFIFSKEVGLLIYLCTVIINACLKTIHKRKITQSDLSVIFFIALPLFIFFLFFISNQFKLWGDINLNLHSSFLISWDYIKTRLSEMFIMNFAWIYSVFCIFSLFFLISRRIKVHFETERISLLFSVFASFLGYVLFNLFFVTFVYPRYILSVTFFLPLFFFILIKQVKLTTYFILSSLIFLNIVLFYSIDNTFDPISNKIFSTMKVGTVTLLQIGDVFSSRSDSMVYNAQYRYIDILLEKLNKEIKINPDTKIIVNTIYDTKLRNINGDWVFYWLTWMRSPIDSSSYKSTFKTHFFIPQIQNTIAVNQKTAPVGKEVYYVFLPWLSFNGVDTDINALKRLYVFGNKKRIEINGYYLEYYQIKRI